jgi:DMSO/TMAO reductase YedYZ molybdopterin-dependent catalytic subunit
VVRYGRRQRAAARKQADAQQGALGARGKIPHRKDLAASGSAPAARTAPDVENPIFWDFAQFSAQPQGKFLSDIHCVTTWSRYDNQWEGLATRDLLDACRPRDEARFVVLHSHDGYTTNLALEDFAAEDALLAHSWSGQPLEQEHGGPVRLVLPHLYFWKSAKWLQSIEFLEQDAPGYWEVRGYHNRGDPWAEQRYSAD